jgi:hypothetical protein
MNRDVLLDDDVAVRIAGLVDAAIDPAAQTAAEAIVDAIGSYAGNPDPNLANDLAAHCRNIFGALARSLREHRPAEPADFPSTTTAAARRVDQGVSLADFMRAYRLAQASLWNELRTRLVADPVARDHALDVVGYVMQVIEAGSQAAASAYLEAEQFRVADHDRVRRDLLDDLLEGRPPSTPARLALAHGLGLGEVTSYVVTCGAPRDAGLDDEGNDEQSGDRLRAAASAIRRELGRSARGLIALRQGEVVGVFPARPGQDLGGALARSAATAGLDLRIGLSTEHSGYASVPVAYREASIARRTCSRLNRVVSLATLTPSEYLALSDDDTARRLIRKELRRFVRDDLDQAGDDVITVLEYVGADLNAKEAASRLGIHVNTMYHRLDRISQRSGCDLRRYSELDELLTAIRLLVPGAAHSMIDRRSS